MLKKSLSSLAIRRFIREVKPLVGAYFQKAYQIDYDTLVLRFAIRKSDLQGDIEDGSLIKEILVAEEEINDNEGISLGEGGGNYARFDLYFKMGGFLFVTSKVEREMPMQPSPFAMKLRKSLNNRILKSIEQVGMDRLVVLRFNPHQDDEGDFKLYLELFGDGNAILVKGDKIIAPFTSRSWATRTIKKGEVFAPPPSGIDTFSLTIDQLENSMKESKDDMVRFLIKRINLPPPYAEEICLRGGFEKKEDIDLTKVRDIYTHIWEILDEVRTGEDCYIHLLNGEPTAIEPVLLASFFEAKDVETVKRRFSEGTAGPRDSYFIEMASINKALETHMFEEDDLESVKKISKKEKKIEKLEKLLITQEEALTKRKKEVEDFKQIADSLYMDYQRIDDLLRSYTRHAYRSDPSSFSDVLEVQEGPGGSVRLKVRVNTKAGQRETFLDADQDINQNAELFYSRSKTARRKIEGIEKALFQTRKNLEMAQKDKQNAEEETSGQKSLRRFWFEAYRWCFTSEKVLLIGGRDAKSNERVVKKYLRDTDIYAHADLSGAASVIARIDKEQEAGEDTMEQACHFSILNSKAWNSKVGSAGGYWVRPDQVSKTPQPGEFVAKGSFIIRGRKNMVDKLPLVGAAGTMYIDGVPKVMFGPEKSVEAVCNGTFFRIIPGRTKKSDISKIIAKELGGELDQVMSVLPPGDMDIFRINREQ